MKALLNRFFAILVFRAGPKDLPHSPVILALLLLVTLALDMVIGRSVQGNDNSPVWIVIRIAVGLGLLWLLLDIVRKSTRFLKTAIALAWVTLVVTLFTFPIILAIWPMPVDFKLLNGTQVAMMSLMFPIFIWFLCVRTFIFKHAFENHPINAFLVGVGLLLAETFITLFLMKLVS